MRRLHIDFIQPATPLLTGWVLLVVAVLLLAATQWQASQLAQSQTRLQASQNPTAVHTSKPARTSAADAEATRKQYLAANEVAMFLQLPWRDLFAALELAASDDVALLAIEPDHRKHQVRVTAEATDYAAMLSYLQRLGDAPQLQQVHLQRYQQQEAGSRAWRFTVEAEWSLGL